MTTPEHDNYILRLSDDVITFKSVNNDPNGH